MKNNNKKITEADKNHGASKDMQGKPWSKEWELEKQTEGLDKVQGEAGVPFKDQSGKKASSGKEGEKEEAGKKKMAECGCKYM